MMRILQVNKLYSPWTGGIENVVQEIAESLCGMPDIHSEVLVCRHKGIRTSADVINGVPITRIGSLGMALSLPVAPSFPFRLESLARGFDIVHVHVPFPLPLLCNWKRLKANGTRLVIHFHSDIVRPLQKCLFRGLKALDRRFMEAADRIIVTSEGLLNNSRALSPFRQKCRVVPLWIDLKATVEPSAAELLGTRQRYGVQDGERVVLFVGRLVYYKGLEYLIEAASQLDAKILIAGDRPLRQSLQDRVRNVGLESKFRFLGTVTDAERSTLYSLSDVFVLPSTGPSEAFGIVQLEAMAHGLPVVNTDLPTGVPSVSVHGETGLTVPPRNSELLRDSLNAILSDTALRRRFSENASKRVHQYSRPIVLEKIRSIYEELAPQRCTTVSAGSLPTLRLATGR